MGKFVRKVERQIMFKRFLVLWIGLLVFSTLGVSGQPRAIRYTNLPATTATYLGGSSADEINAVDFNTSAELLLAGKMPGYNPGGTLPTVLPGGTDGFILRLNSAGTSIVSLTRIGSVVQDLEAGSAGTLACGDFGVALLTSDLTSITWSESTRDYSRCALGSDGFAAAVSGSKVYVFNATGAAQGTVNLNGRSVADVAVHSTTGTVVVTGYTQAASNLQVPFLRGYQYNGTHKWTSYDQSASAVFGQNLGADSRGKRVSIGRDDRLYFAGYTDGGNTIFQRNPKNISQGAALVSTDQYDTPYNISGAKALAWYGRFNAANGNLELGAFLLTRLSDGKGNSIAIESITADENGVVYAAGEAYASLEARSTRQVALTTVGNYEGGESFVFVVSPNFAKRLYWSPFAAPDKSAGGSPMRAIAVRGGAVAAGGIFTITGGRETIRVNALQSAKGGGASDGYAVTWSDAFTLADTPVPTSPIGEQSTHAPLFQWTGDNADEVRVVIYDATGAIFYDTGKLDAEVQCSGASCAWSPASVTPEVSFPNGSYTWRAFAYSVIGKQKSAKAAFTVQFPGKPSLVSPLGDTTVGTNPTLSWSEIAAANEYRVKVTRVSSGVVTNSGWITAACSSGTCSYTFPNPLKKGRHTWRVEARQSGIANKSKSASGSFVVVLPTR